MTPAKAYDDQKRHAEQRGIGFHITYAEWLEMWLISGKWEQRGRAKGQYCMCRYGDVGPYTKRNCYIGLTDENQQEMWRDRRRLLPKNYLTIYEFYTETDMTQYEVADRFGVDQSYVSKVVKKVRERMNG